MPDETLQCTYIFDANGFPIVFINARQQSRPRNKALCPIYIISQPKTPTMLFSLPLSPLFPPFFILSSLELTLKETDSQRNSHHTNTNTHSPRIALRTRLDTQRIIRLPCTHHVDEIDILALFCALRARLGDAFSAGFHKGFLFT